MDRLDRLPALDFANERRDDVFSLEFPDRSDALQARRTAELDGGRQRRSFTGPDLATGLEAVSRRFAPVARRLDGAVADGRRSSRRSTG